MGKKTEGNGHLTASGRPKMNGALEKMESEIQKEENIFLFVPNLIGTFLACVIGSSALSH